MKSDENRPFRVGEVRPSQMLYTYGVGSIVELPNISVMVMGLATWPLDHMDTIHESRLLRAVKSRLSDSVERLMALPKSDDSDEHVLSGIGTPVAVFPRWLYCVSCGLLSKVDSGVFKLKKDLYHPDKTRFEHTNCGNKTSIVVPARFLVACKKGHLDDFPWIEFVHRSAPCDAPSLKLSDTGVSGQAADIWVQCLSCKATRQMSQAFDPENKEALPPCSGNHPHLNGRTEECDEESRAMLLGASNSWFPNIVSIFSIPTETDQLKQVVDKCWDSLSDAETIDDLKKYRKTWVKHGNLPEIKPYSDEELWDAIEARRNQTNSDTAEEDEDNLKIPEWKVFSDPVKAPESDDLKLAAEHPPASFSGLITGVTLAHRLREVSALIAFTRIEAPGESFDESEMDFAGNAPLAGGEITWVPAGEVKGEGVFIQFNEKAIEAWYRKKAVRKREMELFEAWKEWRRIRNIKPYDAGFPGAQYVLLHSFSHALMREMALECGYAAAAIRERIYSATEEMDGISMAGVLIYTAASDSEGTLGGLVSLGRSDRLEQLMTNALDKMKLCSSDPLCAEHDVRPDGKVLHGSACHACLMCPETSCERGNRLLDRSFLVETLGQKGMEFF